MPGLMTVVCVATDAEWKLTDGDVFSVLKTGIGMVNATYALTRLLATERVTEIIVCGIGGAYPGSGLKVGDVVCATTECFADLGAESPDGFLDFSDGKFKLGIRDFPCDSAPFATVNTCTGTDARAHDLAERTGAAVESMEGAALVQVAKKFGVQVGEVRGISNIVGNRDKQSWSIEEAARGAEEVVRVWL